MVAMAEVKGVMPQADPHFYHGHGDGHGAAAPALSPAARPAAAPEASGGTYQQDAYAQSAQDPQGAPSDDPSDAR
jgi:molybdopterin-containing oxidoreductase family membrane subunit